MRSGNATFETEAPSWEGFGGGHLPEHRWVALDGADPGEVLELIRSTEAAGVWTLQSGLHVENEVSRALHKAVGFREVGLRRRLGQREGSWRDIVMVERRSTVVGV